MTELTVKLESLLNFAEAARILSVSRPHIYNLISKHNLRTVTISHNRYLLKEQVEVLKAKLEKEETGVINEAGN